MAESSRKNKRFINRLILVGALGFGLFFVLLVLFYKRPNKHIYLPEEFEGWVTIRYNVEGAEALERKDGEYHIYIPSTGVFTTSTFVKDGWGRDDFYRYKGEQVTEMPKYQLIGEEQHTYVHTHEFNPYSYEGILEDLPVGLDTLLPDGTRIVKKSQEEVSYTPGKRTLETFYVSAKPEPFYFQSPANPNSQALPPLIERYIQQKGKAEENP